MKKYINFSNLELSRNKLTLNIINNCYEYIKDIDRRKLKSKDILPEVKLYYDVK